MLTIRNTTGSIADVIASMKDIPARVVPYAASTALTRTAKIAATKDLPDAMRAVFDRPTPWAINSIFIKPATKDTLAARVMVKDTVSRGNAPEKFLLPEVIGGNRNEKAFEKALRYAGLLAVGERVIPGDNLALDSFGNAPAPLIWSILAWAKNGAKKKNVKSKKVKGVKAQPFKQDNPHGYIQFGNPGAKVRGIAWRSGGIFVPLFIFAKRQPTYRARLDFDGIVLKTADTHFKTEYRRAFEEMRARGKA